MRSARVGPFKLGSEEVVSIHQLAQMRSRPRGRDADDQKLHFEYIFGPFDVRGCDLDNRRIKQTLGWALSHSLREGLKKYCSWVEVCMQLKRDDNHCVTAT